MPPLTVTDQHGGMARGLTVALTSEIPLGEQSEHRPALLTGSRPDHFFVVSKAIGSSVIKNLYIQNYPTHCFSISGSDGLLMENILLNNTAGNAPNNRSDGLAAAHNTDGFDISSTNGMILRDSTVLNQDDCVAITSGDSIAVSNMYCDGKQ